MTSSGTQVPCWDIVVVVAVTLGITPGMVGYSEPTTGYWCSGDIASNLAWLVITVYVLRCVDNLMNPRL